MSLLKYMMIPVGIFIVGVVYWFLAYEAAGAAMLVIFAIAMALMGWILIPTLGDVGPTAPVDPDWHERES